MSDQAVQQEPTAAEAPPGGSPTTTMEPEGKASRGLLRRGKKQKVKAEKAPKEKRPKVKAAGAAGGDRGSWDPGLLSLSDAAPSRDQLEREAADELLRALGPSYHLLREEVPDAASPDDAQRKIESKLGPAPQDNDADLPKHPIYSGDALVYYQLRRHYGRPNPGGSYQRSWWPGS